MSGIFALGPLPGPLNNGYGIRFVDTVPGASASAQQVLELNVQYWTGNGSNPAGDYIRFFVQDFNLHTTATIDVAALNPSGADEIYLSLNRAASSDLFTAEYAYVTGGTLGTLTSLGSAQGFLYENFVRPQFHVFATPVPEPENYAMLLAGLGLLGFMARRRKRQAA